MSNENEGVEIPGEGGVSSLSPEYHKQAQVDKASQKGWQPLEEWVAAGKEASDWVDAGEFLGRQKLYDRLHDSKRQITKLERDLAQINKHFVDMEESAYQRALKDLRDKQAIAVAEQDTQAVVQVSDEIAELKAKQAQKTQQAQASPEAQINEEFSQWKQENPWFEGDTEMTQDAISIGIGYAAANKNKTQQEVLKHVSDRIKKIYPDKFQPKKTTQRSAPVVESGSDNGGEKAVTQKSKGKLTVADLDDREVSVMKTLIRQGALKGLAAKRKISEQQVYLEDLAQAKGLK